jgi:hemolysin-activating ACP:hemolysin acyltransferase
MPDAVQRAQDFAAVPPFRLFRPDRPALALGLAVNYLMTKPAFANLRFGDWSRILVGQINRNHYVFAVDSRNQVRGFVGWALTTRAKAEAWVEGRAPLSHEDSKAGECLVFNAWSAETLKVHRFLVDEARKLISDKETVYFKRHYSDGSARPVRLNVNDFVSGHIARHATGPRAAPSSPPSAALPPQGITAADPGASPSSKAE